MLTEYDELPHRALADEHWRESYYLNFHDPGGDLFGLAWMGVRPNVGHGEVLLAVGRGDELEHVHEDFEIPIARDIGAERSGFGPLTFTLVEPFQRWDVAFSADAVELDLQWRSTTPVYNYGAEWQATQNSWHYQHTGEVSGTIALDGSAARFSGVGVRDRAWGLRSDRSYGCLHWITAQFADGLVFEAMQLGEPGAQQLYGFVQQDGVASVLSEMILRPTYSRPKGPPVAAEIVASDRLGRTFSFEMANRSPAGSCLVDRSGGGPADEIGMFFTFNRFTHRGVSGFGLMDHHWADPDAVLPEYVCREPNVGALCWPPSPQQGGGPDGD